MFVDVTLVENGDEYVDLDGVAVRVEFGNSLVVELCDAEFICHPQDILFDRATGKARRVCDLSIRDINENRIL